MPYYSDSPDWANEVKACLEPQLARLLTAPAFDDKRIDTIAGMLAGELAAVIINNRQEFDYQWDAISPYTYYDPIIDTRLKSAIYNGSVKVGLLNQPDQDELGTVVATLMRPRRYAALVGKLSENSGTKVAFRLGDGYKNDDSPIVGRRAIAVSPELWQLYRNRAYYVETLVSSGSNNELRSTGHHTGFVHSTSGGGTVRLGEVKVVCDEEIGTPSPIYTFKP